MILEEKKAAYDVMLPQLCRAARVDLLDRHSEILKHVPLDHQGIDGRTKEDPPPEIATIIRGQAKLRDPAPHG